MDKEVRYRFITDEDSHWYLIPVALEEEFNNLLENGGEDYYAEFCNRFDEYRCNYPGDFTFVDPQ